MNGSSHDQTLFGNGNCEGLKGFSAKEVKITCRGRQYRSCYGRLRSHRDNTYYRAGKSAGRGISDELVKPFKGV